MNRKLRNHELNRKTVKEFKQAEKIPLLVVLDNIRSLNNVGSVFRSSDAFTVEKIYLCGITPTPPHKDIHKTALGATDSVDWEYKESTAQLIEELNTQNVHTIAIEQAEHSVMLNDFKVENTSKYALVFGHEVKGVDQEVVDLCKTVIEIPQLGTKHSLNISVSAGVVIWDFFRKIGIK